MREETVHCDIDRTCKQRIQINNRNVRSTVVYQHSRNPVGCEKTGNGIRMVLKISFPQINTKADLFF